MIQKMMTDVDHVLTNKEFFQMNIVEIVPKDKELIPCPKFVEFALMDKEFFKLDFVEFALMEKALILTTNAGHARMDRRLTLPQIFVLSHKTFLFQSMLRQTLNKMLETREMTFVYSFRIL